eukprot:7384631-Prymnesium_polylepis.2
MPAMLADAGTAAVFRCTHVVWLAQRLPCRIIHAPFGNAVAREGRPLRRQGAIDGWVGRGGLHDFARALLGSKPSTTQVDASTRTGALHSAADDFAPRDGSSEIGRCESKKPPLKVVCSGRAAGGDKTTVTLVGVGWVAGGSTRGWPGRRASVSQLKASVRLDHVQFGPAPQSRWRVASQYCVPGMRSEITTRGWSEVWERKGRKMRVGCVLFCSDDT